MDSPTSLNKPIRPMTIDDLLFQLTSRGYVKGADMDPPDDRGRCRFLNPGPGVAFWRSRSFWQAQIDGLDYISVYPCETDDEDGDTFLFVVFNPRNGVIQEWRIGEHWGGSDFLIQGCRSLEMALFTHQNWLAQVTAEHE